MTDSRLDLLQGSLDMLVLQVLSLEPMHGWGISQRIQQRSGDEFKITQGSLYPALHRLQRQGWIDAEWATTENNRRAKYYSLSAAGRGQLERESAQWHRMVTAVARVMEPV